VRMMILLALMSRSMDSRCYRAALGMHACPHIQCPGPAGSRRDMVHNALADEQKRQLPSWRFNLVAVKEQFGDITMHA
jgi:hypothetical protein